MFTFTPLAGARTTTTASQSLLELDGGIKILVDVGWDENFDASLLAEIEKHTPTLSFILLTHATLSHLGAFIHCQKFIPNFSQIPVFATLPVITFGATLLKELYRIKKSSSPDERLRKLQDELAPTAEEIDKYFSFITPLKYSQPHQPKASFFSAPLEDLTITAYNSGHTLGGAIWHIQYEMESIVYAVDWNIVRENVIPAAAWFGGVGGSEVLEALRNPTALVCSSRGANQVAAVSGRKARDDIFLDHVRSCVSRGGSVLIPAVPLSRLLEMAWIIEKAWQEASDDSPLRGTKVYIASNRAHSMLRNARSLLDWMNESISKEFEDESKSASRVFEFQHIKLLEKSKRFEAALNEEGAKVILTGDPSLEWPLFSRPALTELARSSDNLIMLTNDKTSDATQSLLLQMCKDREDGIALEKIPGRDAAIEQIYGGGREITFSRRTRLPLDAADLQTLQSLAARRQLESTLVSANDALLANAEDAIEDDSSSSEDESDDEHQGRVLNVSSALGGKKGKTVVTDEELGVSILLRKKGVHDYDVRNKRGRNAVFPYTHSRRRGDEYGDYIRPEDFMRAEEKDAAQMASQQLGGDSSLKRKWDVVRQDKLDASSKRRRSPSLGLGNRAQSEGQSPQAAEEDSEESEDEAEAPATLDSSITINARLALVDFVGIHDQRSLQMLIPLIGSKKVVLIEGNEEETSQLASDCNDLLSIKEPGSSKENAPTIFTPVIGEPIDASVDTDTWDVKLGKALFKKLHWEPVQGRNVATLTGEVRAGIDELNGDLPDRTKRLRLTKESEGVENKQESKSSSNPVLDVMSASSAQSALSMARPIHVGDVVLKELQRLMIDAGHKARFAGGGTLLVDDMVAVRKLGTGQIVVEGAPVSAVSAMTGAARHDSFTQVKRKIYEGLPVVAAG